MQEYFYNILKNTLLPNRIFRVLTLKSGLYPTYRKGCTMVNSCYNRIVVKVGTTTLAHETGKLNLRRMDRLARVISDIKNSGKQVVLVSSGAVAAGAAKVNLDHIPMTLIEKQAMAAIGQTELMRIYERFFSGYGHNVAQILLTKSVMEKDEPMQNAKNTFKTLFEMGVIPIVNENDSISYHGIKFGGNDTLAALVALICDADILINLSDINGLYNKDPRANDDAVKIDTVASVTDEIYRMAGAEGSARGTGGMRAKIDAAKQVTEAGISMVIANGQEPEILYDIIGGVPCGTFFAPQEKRRKGL